MYIDVVQQFDWIGGTTIKNRTIDELDGAGQIVHDARSLILLDNN